jgi:hypothetical protein
VAVLQVECNSKEEAQLWADKIVVTLENHNGHSMSSDEIIDFETEITPSKISIKQLPQNPL